MELESKFSLLLHGRVWNFDKRTKEGIPTLARTIRAVIPGAKQSSVMAITAHENMNMIAVGFKDGTVLMIRGNIARDRQSRFRVVHEEATPNVYITGKSNISPTSGGLYMFDWFFL